MDVRQRERGKGEFPGSRDCLCAGIQHLVADELKLGMNRRKQDVLDFRWRRISQLPVALPRVRVFLVGMVLILQAHVYLVSYYFHCRCHFRYRRVSPSVA